jgi:CHAT domain-containing protein/tetratricopeptide (TPR) repeat protein
MTMRGGRCAARVVAGVVAVALCWPTVVSAGLAGPAFRQQPGQPQAAQPTSPAPGQTAFAEGLRLLAAQDHDAARRQFEEALRLAGETGDTRRAAGCHRGLGLVAAAQGQQDVAVQEHRLARALFIQAGDRAYAGASAQSLGTALYWLGRRDEAREAWQAALDDYAAVDDRAQQASVIYNLTFVAASTDEKRQLLDRGLSLAEAAANRPLEGQLLAARSDLAFTHGDYRAAYDDVLQGIAVLGEAGSGARKGLAHAYTSLGRLYRAHAQFEAAIAAYERALAISRELGDLFAQAQAARAIAIAYDYLGRQEPRRRFLALSLELIRRTQIVNEQYFSEVHLAAYLVDAGDHRAALTILEPIAATEWGRGSEWAQNTLAGARMAAGDAAGAIEPATRAVELSHRAGDVERLFHGLQVRAQACMALGRYEQALADVREALDLVEGLRQRLVPHDYMKRGFMDRFTEIFGLAIETFEALGRHAEAVEVAERARARAFADLLIARQVGRQPEPLPVGDLIASGASVARPPPASTAGRDAQATRGAEARLPAGADDDLPSDALAGPATASDLRRFAAATRTTILSYWVGQQTTWTWVVAPGGDIATARVDVREERLRTLVRGVWQATPPAGRRGAWREHEADASARTATQELYRLLIAPVRPALERAGVARLTVIPHGPLAALSFAALQDAGRRYLIEDYTLSYVPAGWMLTLTATQAPGPAARDAYLLIGAPSTLPAVGAAPGLSLLPGAGRELGRVASRVPRAHAIRLTGPDATEAGFRDAAPKASVMHVATHGVMLDEAPLDSFLAFDASGREDTSSNDGRLTAREVYDLDLHASLVVLSACRSGLGRPSGDGVFGIARAFFYAGAQTVVATLWDVADEPAARLMPGFHERVAGGDSASDALRAAQLGLLRDLRAGRVIVRGRRGPVPLPEHPSLWAGFVLIGKP